MTAPVSAVRRGMLAKIHIACKHLGLDDFEYRSLLERVTGETSAAACSDAQLERVIGEAQRLGWRPTGGTFRPSEDPQVRKVYALWSALGKQGALRDPSKRALRAFVAHRFTVQSVEWLGTEQASQLIELLKSWQRRVRKGEPIDE